MYNVPGFHLDFIQVYFKKIAIVCYYATPVMVGLRERVEKFGISISPNVFH